MPKRRKTPLSIRRFLVECGLARATELSQLDRAELFSLFSNLLEGQESEEAELVAFNLREMETHQLKLQQLLKPGGAK